MESRGLSNRSRSGVIGVILTGLFLCLTLSVSQAQTKLTPEQQEKILESKKTVTTKTLTDKSAKHNRVQPTAVRRPQMATSSKAAVPVHAPPTREDLQRQIKALVDKLEYAAANPQYFKQPDLDKMQHALSLKQKQLLALDKVEE